MRAEAALRAAARGIAADVLPFPEGNGGTGADSPTRVGRSPAKRLAQIIP
jgi:hypothetical protein